MSQETDAAPTFVSKSDVEHLRSLLDAASDYLPGVTSRKMFGCYTLFANDHIYALVWPQDGGRIGLKIPEQAAYDELMSIPGAALWSPNGEKTGWWVLVPPSFHADEENLKEKLLAWVERAHGYAMTAPPKPKRNRSKIRK